MARKLEFIVNVDETQIKEMLRDNDVEVSDINMSVLLGLFKNASMLATLKSSLLEVIAAQCQSIIKNNVDSFDKEDNNSDDSDSGSNDYDSYDDSYDEDRDSN